MCAEVLVCLLAAFSGIERQTVVGHVEQEERGWGKHSHLALPGNTSAGRISTTLLSVISIGSSRPWECVQNFGRESSGQHTSKKKKTFEVLKVKVKRSRYRPGVAQRVGRGIALLFHDRGTRRGWVVSSTPRPHFTPGKDPVPILQEVGLAPGPVWKGGKSRPHRDSIPDRPARSQSLYRLSYRAYIWWFNANLRCTSGSGTQQRNCIGGLEVIMTGTVFWDVTPCTDV